MKYPEIKKRATELRKNPTGAEALLWLNLRKRKLKGMKFLRQHPIIYDRNGNEHFFFIPDFYCSEAKLAIELDGPIHKRTFERDVHRDEILKAQGIRVLRIMNEELKNMENVLDKVKGMIEQ
ncbi:MAG: endonuclease domain-containing protein [Tenuifilaceae bacterium]